MKLKINRGQSKGMMGMGGISFEVRAQVQLTGEETELVRHYKLDNEVLANKPIRILGAETGRVMQITVASLVMGTTHKAPSLGEVEGYVQTLEEACRTLKSYLNVARTFGGEQTIDI